MHKDGRCLDKSDHIAKTIIASTTNPITMKTYCWQQDKSYQNKKSYHNAETRASRFNALMCQKLTASMTNHIVMLRHNVWRNQITLQKAGLLVGQIIL